MACKYYNTQNVDFANQSGSNANGSWIKFPDGTMICNVTNLPEATTNQANGALFFTDNIPVTLPEPMAVIHAVHVSVKWSSSRPFSGFWAETSLPGVDFTVRFAGATSTSRGVPSVTAVGRWK